MGGCISECNLYKTVEEEIQQTLGKREEWAKTMNLRRSLPPGKKSFKARLPSIQCLTKEEDIVDDGTQNLNEYITPLLGMFHTHSGYNA